MANFTHEDASLNFYFRYFLRATEDADNIDTTQGNDKYEIYAGGGDDLVNDDQGSSVIYGEAGNDTIHGGGGDDGLSGGAGDDFISATSGENSLNGSSGNDTLLGGSGNDYIYGGADDDIMTGGSGNDLIAGDVSHQYTDTGIDEVIFNSASTEVTGFEQNDNYVRIVTPEGTDTIYAVEKFTFTDVTILEENLSTVFAGLPIYDDQIVNSSYEANIVTDHGNDTINLSPHYTVDQYYIDTKGGNDTIHASGSLNALIDGGDGLDTLSLLYGSSNITAYFEENNQLSILSTLGMLTLSNIENIELIDQSFTIDTFKSHFSEYLIDSTTILGTRADDSLNGTGGDDLIFSNIGSDTIDGKAGIDTAIFNFEPSNILEYSRNADQIDLFYAQGGYEYRLINIEQVRFLSNTYSASQLDTLLAGVNKNDQTITGTTENDSLVVGYGNDNVDGLVGNDTVSLNIASSQVQSYRNENGVIYITSERLGSDSFANIETFQFTDKTVTSSELDTAFNLVNTGGQTYYATANDDYISGGLGEDSIILNIATSDITSYSFGYNRVQINSNGTVDEFINIENFVFTDQSIGYAALYELLPHLRSDDQVIHSAVINSDEVIGGLGNDELLGASGNELLRGNAGHDRLDGLDGDDTLYGDDGDDTLAGWDGHDIIYGGDGDDRIYGDDPNYKVNISSEGDGDDRIFGGAGNDLIYGNEGNNHLEGGDGDDWIYGGEDEDYIDGGAGNDSLFVTSSKNYVDGGDGEDTLVINLETSFAVINSVTRKIDSSIVIETPEEATRVINVEKVLVDPSTTISIDAFVGRYNQNTLFFDAVLDGKSIQVTPERYTGVVDFLEYQLLGDTAGNVVIGSDANDFLNLLEGDDAANGGAGQDVLDGGTGSNFLTGGSGSDTFFLDGRGGAVTWSTVTDFDSDTVNIWGWVEGVSQLVISETFAGADGFKGATYHFDLNNDGTIDTSITFSGLSIDNVPAQSAEVVADNGYLLFS